MKKKIKKPLCPQDSNQIDNLTHKQQVELLKYLFEQLEDIGDDLGTEGWKHRFGLED